MAERPGPVHITTAADVVAAEALDADIVLPPMAPARSSIQVFAAPGAADPVERLKTAICAPAHMRLSDLRGMLGRETRL